MTQDPYALKFRTADDTTGQVQKVLSKLEANGFVNEILRLLANSELGFRPFVQMSNAFLTRSSLPATVREATILTMAARLDVTYEWQEHVAWGERVGLTPEQCAAISEGRVEAPALFDAEHRLAMRIAGELLDGEELQQSTWEQMCDTWGKEQAFDLVFVMAWWGGFVPMAIRCLGIHGLR